jgi:hypothetical protein
MCWVGSQHILEVFGADIGTFGCWSTGEFLLGPEREEKEGRRDKGADERQWASSYGIHIIPYNRLQKYVTSIDLRSAVRENIAFKLSFGTTFALAAFMQF